MDAQRAERTKASYGSHRDVGNFPPIEKPDNRGPSSETPPARIWHSWEVVQKVMDRQRELSEFLKNKSLSEKGTSTDEESRSETDSITKRDEVTGSPTDNHPGNLSAEDDEAKDKKEQPDTETGASHS